MRRTFLLAVGMIAALAGCGGGGGTGGTKPPDPRAQLDGWIAHADAACKEANEEIADRGWPANLVDLDRLSVRAANDVREASAKIQKLPAPKGAEKRIAPFVNSLRGLDVLLDRVTDTTEKFKPARLTALAPRIQSGLLDVEKASKALGLRECAANEEHVWVPDAIRAPVFAQQLADLNSRIRHRSKGLATPASTPAGASRKLDRISRLVALADRGLSKLKPPSWAEEEARAYLRALRDFGSTLDSASTLIGGSGLTPARLAGAERKLARADRLQQKRFRTLFRAIGAIPTVPGGRDGGGSDETPAGDDTQAA
jgi:hypothetical protein